MVLLDEPGLFAFRSTAEAVLHIEPPEAENEIRAAFDTDGVPYRVQWKPRPKGWRAWLAPIEYEFVPDGAAAPDRFTAVLKGGLEYVTPAEHRPRLTRLLADWEG